MRKAVQQRTLETRARLTEVAQALVTEKGFEALRIDEVVQRAGVSVGLAPETKPRCAPRLLLLGSAASIVLNNL